MACHRNGLQVSQSEALAICLARLPVTLLDAAVTHVDDLLSLGVRSIGDLLQLPRAGLSRRFGRPLLDELDQALGHSPEHWPSFEAPARFDTDLQLPAPIEHTEALGFATQRLLEPLCGWLAAHQAGARGFKLQLKHERQPDTVLTVRLSSPAQTIERLSTLLREHLQRTRLSAPVSGLALSCDSIEPLQVHSYELFSGGQDTGDDMARLIERLQTRLGPDTVNRLYRVAEHRPEYAHRLEPLHDWPTRPEKAFRAASALPACADTLRLPRPLWLLAQAQPIQERNNRPFWQGPLALLAGPERIEAGWWDGNLVQRDYFIAENDSHRLLWIYRERATSKPLDTSRSSGWFVQGYFG
jgi:protein ImuB